jgi:protein-S-isoprenylcysteine O-methyltransferase Ste14
VITAEAASSGVLFLFMVTWLAAAMWAGRKTGGMPLRELAPLYGGGALFCVALTASLVIPAMKARLWPPLPALDWTMVALCVAGCTFCWWARLHLGRLWSGGVIVREGHRVVDTGPYAIVRHPIYSGIFLAMIAFAAIRARPSGILFVAGLVVFFTLKARMEERFLRQELGTAYDDYRGRVPMLVPRWTSRR